jgi:MFS family permease
MHQPRSRLNFAFPALRSRNYRLFFAGQMVSLIGTWMQQIAMTWLAYRLTDSVAMLGLVGFAGQIPILLFSAYAGVWNDRLDRRRLLMATQALSMAQALLLFGLTMTHLITPTALVGLAFLLGCINAVDLPARQAFVAQLVDDKADLPNAIGLNSFLMNASRFVGPALAGLLVATAGEAACFLINAGSYLAVLLALTAIRVAARPPRPHQPAWTALRSGFDYAFRHPQIRLPLMMVAGFSFLVTPYAVMMPVFAREFFQGGAETYGFLIGSAGFGSLSAALFLAFRGSQQHGGLDRLVARATLTGGTLLAAFALTPTITIAYPLLATLGFSVILTVAGSNTLIQMVVEDDYRGRVMALFSTAFLGIAPLGSLAVGALAEVWDVRPTLLCCGLGAAMLGIAYLRQIGRARSQEP